MPIWQALTKKFKRLEKTGCELVVQKNGDFSQEKSKFGLLSENKVVGNSPFVGGKT